MILLSSFLGLAVCLCCVELLHMAFKGRGRRMMSRWLKPHGSTHESDSEATSESEESHSTRAQL